MDEVLPPLSIRKVFFTLTLTLSPQGRGKNMREISGGEGWDDFLPGYSGQAGV